MFNLTDNNTNQDAEKATAKASTSKVKKPRFKKLTGAEVADLPGVNSATLKAVEPDLTYFIYFAVPLTDLVGSVTEANQIHDFAYKLDVEAKANKVGSVTTVAFGSGSAEIVLKLEATGPQPSLGAPVSHAFVQLKQFLNSALVLTQDYSGKRASWKAKINGTTIVDGHF